jgi:hypothetical protein
LPIERGERCCQLNVATASLTGFPVAVASVHPCCTTWRGAEGGCSLSFAIQE